MSGRKKWAWAALVMAASAAPAGAQTGGISGGGSTGGGGGGLTSSGLASTLNTTNASGGSGVGAGGLGNSGTGPAAQQAVGAYGVNLATGNARSSQDASNPFAGFYANPLYAGRAGQGGPSVAPGGFGTPLYTLTSTGTAAGGRGATGRTGAAGLGATGMGGRGGLGGTNQSGIVVPIPVQINYAAQIRFRTPPTAPANIQGDIRNTLDNSSLIADGRSVQVITDAQNNVTLRGVVRDEEEARIIEGVVRLTPGVRVIQNELTVAPQK